MISEQTHKPPDADPLHVVGPRAAWEGRAILLLDLDAFFASVEQLDHPAWRGKPVIVGGSADARGVISTASYEARVYGVHSAMPASTARRLCPDAIWTHGRYSRYKEVSRKVMAIMLDASPFLQQVSIDEAFLDVSPTVHNRSDPVQLARTIQERVARLGISCSIGLGSSKAVAKTASEQHKPHGITAVMPGCEAAFLAPLPTKRMSGIGTVAQERLAEFGIHTLGEVACADDDVLRRVFGKNADMMRARCKGADTDPVSAERDPAKSVGNEISFARDLTRRDDIEAALGTVAAKVGRRLRRTGLKAGTLTLKVRYGNLKVRTAQQRLEAPSDDESVFAPILSRLLDDVWHPGTALRLVGAQASNFEVGGEAPRQLSLFSLDGDGDSESIAPSPDRRALHAATDSVRDRFGEDAVQYGRELRTNANLTGSGSKNPADYRD